MFAVPGWSLSASNLKTQTAPIPSLTQSQAPQDGEANPTVEKKSRKRKREHNKAIDVTAENVGELWQTVIEGRPSSKDTKKPDKPNGKEVRKPNKRLRRQEAKAAREKEEIVDQTHQHLPPPPDVSNDAEIPIAAATQNPTSSSPLPSTAPLPTSNLTPLQSRMQAKLTSARFRHLNQTLYTTSSSSSLAFFTSTPEAYGAYHAGFRAQVGTWPENPVVGFIGDVERRWRERRGVGRDVNGFRRRGKSGGGGGGGEGEVRPLPSGRDGICRIVDLGCGDATLAASLRQLTAEATGAERKREKGKGGGGKEGGKGALEITSVDLAKGDGPNQGLVTVGDVTDLKALGVRDGSIDVAVCCLSLMGTNWVGVVDECARVTRDGSEVWVAEIKSRFAKPRTAKKGGIGEKKKEKGGKRKKGDEEDEVEDEEMAALEEKKDAGETDVSAFVEVWRKRGFSLAADPEMGNKMFVKMRFVRTGRAGGGQNGVMSSHSRFTVQDDAGSGAIDESKALKPCVYKTR
ncbi:MAG: 25S rRNA (adenine645-N1)-methyltransferase [Ramalina farinacea]|uniref:Ribosomal RNA-processing protein 8 n=1 Tax=Ramalina farinacea TaxID=258253 RepID=A0AA43TY65_9LECA|nr:25S rRNA (adenine645-N1)-methyltransferase [Ramalina farinacea]